jgi:hypothetical protein
MVQFIKETVESGSNLIRQKEEEDRKGHQDKRLTRYGERKGIGCDG